MDSRRKLRVCESVEERCEQPEKNPQRMRAAKKIRRGLTRASIGDFSHDGGMFRAGGGGEIVCLAVPGLVGKHGEGEGFFGIAGDAEFVGGNDFQRGQQGDEIGDEKRISRPASGNDEVTHMRAREDEIP